MAFSVARMQITYETAQGILAAALNYAQENEWRVAVAVVDPSGYLVCFGRTDGVASPIGQFAIDKAYTAGTLSKSTRDFGERMGSAPSLSLGLGSRDRFLTWGGGVPVIEGSVCIGGLGVSGAQEHEDIECAEVAVRGAGLMPG